MRKLVLAVAALGLAVSLGTPVSAGIYTDDLSRCLVRSTSQADQAVLMRWIFAMFSASPVVSSMTNATDEQRKAADKQSADLFQRLVLVDCHSEAVNGLKFEGGAAFEVSFTTLGQVAVRGLMVDPKVGAEMQRFGSYFDEQKLQALRSEAGILPSSAAATAGK